MKFTKIAPLKSSFMVISIIGFFVSVLMIYKYSPSFGFAFALVFSAMFVASVISMTYAPIEELSRYDLRRHLEAEHVKEVKSKRIAKKKPVRKVKKKAGKRR